MLELEIQRGDKMFVGRATELKFLQNYYQKGGNSLIVLYGREGVGKTELLRIFTKGKSYFYYNAVLCSEQEQLNRIKKELQEAYQIEGAELTFTALFMQALEKMEGKKIIVIDEFHQIIKNTTNFMDSIAAILDSQQLGEVMILLCSSSVNWIENDMVNEVGEKANYISAFQKIKEFSILEVSERFPDYTMEECITVYGILGGIPKYWNYWNEKESIEENINRLFLSKEGFLFCEAENYLKSELRELAFYNTILAALAADNIKLNDIYENTGFSRAKISVYLKNLIQLDIVEKVFSFETEEKENVKKGLYRIRDHYIHFWYRFVFPNISYIDMRKPIYKTKVLPYLEDYLSLYFKKICGEYLGFMNEYGRLPVKFEKYGSWFGKEGDIDFIAESEQGNILLSCSKWSSHPMNETDLEKILQLVIQAGIQPEYYYLFSKEGFTESLTEKAKHVKSIHLIPLEGL